MQAIDVKICTNFKWWGVLKMDNQEYQNNQEYQKYQKEYQEKKKKKNIGNFFGNNNLQCWGTCD